MLKDLPSPSPLVPCVCCSFIASANLTSPSACDVSISGSEVAGITEDEDRMVSPAMAEEGSDRKDRRNAM